MNDELIEAVPVFPLPHVVLFPEARLPLHIFEPRYRAMLADCLASEHKSIIIAQLDRSGGGRIAKIAGLGVVVEHRSLPDGRSNLILVGRARVSVRELAPEDGSYPYRRAVAERLSSRDVTVSDGDRSSLLAAATMFSGEVKKHDPTFRFQLPTTSDAGAIADTCAFQLIVDANVRQNILEELNPRVRVRVVMEQLALQHGAMLGETKGAVLN